MPAVTDPFAQFQQSGCDQRLFIDQLQDRFQPIGVDVGSRSITRQDEFHAIALHGAIATPQWHLDAMSRFQLATQLVGHQIIVGPEWLLREHNPRTLPIRLVVQRPRRGSCVKKCLLLGHHKNNKQKHYERPL